MAGTQDRFTDFSTAANARVAGLGDGRHVLEVRAAHREDDPSPTARLEFEIAAPWSRSPLGRATLALGVAAAIGLAGLGFAAGLRRRNRALAALVRSRTEELERGRADALRLAEEFSALFEGSPAPFAEMELDDSHEGGRVLRANDAWRAGFGHAGVAAPFSAVRVAGETSPLEAARAAAAGRETEAHADVVGADGVSRRWSFRFAPRAGQGRLLVSAVDESERVRRAEDRRREDLRRLEAERLEALGHIAGGVAHDFNNLLTAILGNLGAARAELAPGSPAEPPLWQLERAAERAAGLCRQMLAGAGRGAGARERVDLGALAQEMSELLRAALGHRARLELRRGSGTCAAAVDAAQVRRVLLNLITNAAEALPDGAGEVIVSVGCEVFEAPRPAAAGLTLAPGRYAFVRVDDSGPGVPTDLRERIFEPFFSTKFVGRGLGLAATLGVVRAHGGAVEIGSSPAGGARVTAYFPAVDAPDAPQPEAATPASVAPARLSPNGARAVVIDDEPAVLEVALGALRAGGFIAVGAADGATARATLASTDPHVIVLDWTMPAPSGPTLLRALRDAAPRAAIIVVSGFPEATVRAEAAATGVEFEFLAKPFRPRELAARCAALAAIGAA